MGVEGVAAVEGMVAISLFAPKLQFSTRPPLYQLTVLLAAKVGLEGMGQTAVGVVRVVVAEGVEVQAGMAATAGLWSWSMAHYREWGRLL